MNDQSTSAGSQLGRIGLIILSLFGTVFGIGVAAGILAANVDRGGPYGFRMVAMMAAATLFAAAFAWLGYRSVRALTSAVGKPTSRERRNYIVLLASGAIGGVLGATLVVGGGSPLAAFSNDPLPAWLALLLAATIVVLLPLISLYWHRHAVDEQEAAAYRLGALLGIYTYFIVSPAWWLLWRGGLLPGPDGILIYFATITVTGITWIWAKYR